MAIIEPVVLVEDHVLPDRRIAILSQYGRYMVREHHGDPWSACRIVGNSYSYTTIKAARAKVRAEHAGGR